MARVSSRNRAVTLYHNGKAGSGFRDVAERFGQTASRLGEAENKARIGLIRRTLPAARRVIRSRFNVRAAQLMDTLRVEEHNSGKGDAVAIWASARRISLIEFDGRWRGPARSKGGTFSAPATAEVVRGEREAVPGAFISTIKGRRAIRVRTYGNNGRRVHRGPVRMLYGPSPLFMLRPSEHQTSASRAARDARDAVLEEMRGFYSTELARQYRRLNGGRA